MYCRSPGTSVNPSFVLPQKVRFRYKLEGRDEWTTSSWVVDEKAYALAGNRKLVLLREAGVTSIGGLQGDYEYLQFDRSKLEDLMVSLVEVFLSDD